MERNHRINFRVTKEEREAIEILAARENRDISEFLREVVREALERRGLNTIGLVAWLSPKLEGKDV